MKKFFSLLILCLIIFSTPAHACFKKKQKLDQSEKMVQTRQEWEEKAKNVNLENRKIEPYQKPKDDTHLPKDDPYKKFVKYNTPPGSAEVDLSKLKRIMDIRSQGVVEPNFRFMAYSEYYYSPHNNQISSDIFIQKMQTSLSRVKRVLDANILDNKRTPVISAGTHEFKNNLFNTLTIVDWSKNSKKLLVKEKVGSSVTGIFQTYIWIYFMEDENSYARKYSELNDAIRQYWGQKLKLAMNYYRWDIRPLGFSKEKPDSVIAHAIAWDKDKKEIFLGVWELDLNESKINLLSETPIDIPISINGLILKEYLP